MYAGNMFDLAGVGKLFCEAALAIRSADFRIFRRT
jgi:hypothetical protein